MLILASASPRRQELLKLIDSSFVCAPANIDETVTENIETEKIPEYLALKKARHVYGSNPDSTVIGCDTGVFLDGEMIGKPKDEADAFEILKKLSGRTHKVITGCAVIGKNGEKSFSQITEVDFYTMSDDEILDYIKTGEPMDKAGAYGIQGFAARFIKEIRGDYFNVVGLPVSMLYRALRKNDHIKN